MAKSSSTAIRGAGADKPLTAAERRRVIEAPWPVVNIWDSGKSWGGTTKRESIIPDNGARSWSRAGYGDGDATDD